MVTPGTLKSNGSISISFSLANGIIKPPKHASTCNPIFHFFAMVPRFFMGSIIKYGKLGAEPTSYTIIYNYTYCIFIYRFLN